MEVEPLKAENLLSNSRKYGKLFDEMIDSASDLKDLKSMNDSGKYKQSFNNDKENSSGRSNIFPVENIKKKVDDFSKSISKAADAFQHTDYKSGEISPSKDTNVESDNPTTWETACEIAAFSWDVTKDAIVSAEESIEHAVGPTVHNISDTIVADVHYLTDAAKHAASVTKDVIVNAEERLENAVGPTVHNITDTIVEDVRYLSDAAKYAANAVVETFTIDESPADGKSRGEEGNNFIDFSDMAGLGIEIPVGLCSQHQSVMAFETPGGGRYEAPVSAAKETSPLLHELGMPTSQASDGNVEPTRISPKRKADALRPEPHIDMCTPISGTSFSSMDVNASGSALASGKTEESKEMMDEEDEDKDWERAEKYHRRHVGGSSGEHLRKK